jgi:protein-tyrosine phosphatase
LVARLFWEQEVAGSSPAAPTSKLEEAVLQARTRGPLLRLEEAVKAVERRVLFICTGNFYRSRFAEAVFNHHARTRLPGCSAFSRGLSLHPPQGDLSPYTVRALEERGIALSHTAPRCATLTEADLAIADRRIALKEREHRPLIARQFPEWEAHIQFWDVSDVDYVPAAEALPLIEQQVLALIEELEQVELAVRAE